MPSGSSPSSGRWGRSNAPDNDRQRIGAQAACPQDAGSGAFHPGTPEAESSLGDVFTSACVRGVIADTYHLLPLSVPRQSELNTTAGSSLIARFLRSTRSWEPRHYGASVPWLMCIANAVHSRQRPLRTIAESSSPWPHALSHILEGSSGPPGRDYFGVRRTPGFGSQCFV